MLRRLRYFFLIIVRLGSSFFQIENRTRSLIVLLLVIKGVVQVMARRWRDYLWMHAVDTWMHHRIILLVWNVHGLISNNMVIARISM